MKMILKAVSQLWHLAV